MEFFPGAKSLLKRVIHKKSPKFCYLMKLYMFFKGLCLLFYPNVPGATFIQGAKLILESRVRGLKGKFGFKELSFQWVKKSIQNTALSLVQFQN